MSYRTMSGSESSFDGIKVDFDDDSDSDLAQSGTSFGSAGLGGRGIGIVVPVLQSVTSPSPSLSAFASTRMINTGSTGSLNCGPNANNWVLGVRHLSFASNSLNQRMAKRGKQFSNHFTSNLVCDSKLNYNYVQKRDNKWSLKHPMEDIEEVSAESFDTFHSHQINDISDYQTIAFNKMKDKKQTIESSDRVVSSGVKSSKEKCEKSVHQTNQTNRHNQRKSSDVSNTDKTSKSTSVPTGSKSFSVSIIDSTIENNGTNRTICGKRTKTCDKNANYCENNNKNLINPPLIKKESFNPTQTPNETSANYKRAVNLVALSAEQELQRYKSQRFCETVSLITIIFGIILVTITPFLLIPIWVIPNPYSPLIRNILWLSLLTSVLLLSLAALTGNIYWYYDEKRHKWKWFYHCGKGPIDHYWGSTLLHNSKPLKSLSKKVRTNISINV